MSTNTYVALDKATISGSSTNVVTFNSIPSTYTDLRIVVSGSAASGSYLTLRFNNETTTGNYSTTELYGDGTSAGSVRNNSASGPYLYIASIGSTQSDATIDIMNYANATTYKTTLARNGVPGVVKAVVGLWKATPQAITRIDVGTGGSTNFTAGTTISLYGIAAASVGAKATGGTIYADDQYYYHVFGSTGTFTPLSSLTADVLVVAGGGGGSNAGGGGGAGGLAFYSSQSLTATGYTCTIGGGGAGSTGGAYATIGVNSSFTGLTAAVGGGPGGRAATGTNNQTPKTGGSGGGSGGGGVDYAYPGLGTTGQGYAGGQGVSAVPPGSAGGGGGAGGVGTNGSGNNGGAGGVGSSTYSSWLSATGLGVSGKIAGGGGGGGGQPGSGNSIGGTSDGGGGAGGYGAVPTAQNGFAGTANTGGGGGGGGIGSVVDGNGAAGGSGVVIIRYLKA